MRTIMIRGLLFLFLASIFGFTVQARHIPEGDLDNNYKVDVEDLKLFAAQWLNPSGCSGPDCADYNGKGGVNFADLAFLAGNFGNGNTQITLVINELMASNSNFVVDEFEDSDDWIEIYNYGNAPVDIADMYITDSLAQPTRWRIPDNNRQKTIIQPKGFLLIWADEEPYEGTLHTNFKLNATEGDQIALSDAAGNLIDSISFGPQAANQSYGRLPDGSADWQVFNINTSPPPTPGKANSGAPSSGQIVINEIMYHPSSENDLEEYTELYNQGTTTVNLSGWRFIDGVQYTFPQGQTIGPQSYLVVAANVSIFRAKYPAATNVIGGWTGKLSNKGEKITLVDDTSIIIDEVRYADEGDWSVRLLGPLDYGHRGWIWSDEHDGGGKSLELINPKMPNECGQNWLASLANGGTPGTANSATAADIAPLIIDVSHYPVIPTSSDSVTVKCSVIDELSSKPSVTLYYKTDSATTFNSAVMYDDGAHNDEYADDGIFAAQIPAWPDKTIIEFYIQASDSGGKVRLLPAPSIVDGLPQQMTNCLYLVDNAFNPSWTAGNEPLYYIIMKQSERTELEEISDADSDPFTGEGKSDAQMNSTFISQDGTDIKVRYNVGVRNRGNRSRVAPPMNYHINFRGDQPWKDLTALTINSKFAFLQVLGHAMHKLSGLQSPDAALVQVRINGTNLALTDWNRTFGSYAAFGAYNGEFCESHFPDDPDGSLYRCAYFRDNVNPIIYADLIYRGNNPEDYVLNYIKQTNEEAADYNDIFAISFALSPESINHIPDSNFYAEVNDVVNIERWMRYLAVDSLLGNTEGGLNTGDGDDYAMYRGAVDQRFQLLPHDLDTILGQGSGTVGTARSIFSFGEVDGLYRMLNQPQIVQIYYKQLIYLMDTAFAPENFNNTIEKILGNSSVPQANIDSMKQFVANRIASVRSQIPQSFTVGCNLPKSGIYYRTTDSNTAVSGTANAVNTNSVLVNGKITNWDIISGKWSIGQGGGQIVNQVNLVPENATKRVFVPTSDIGTTWRGASEPYNDSAWTHGTPIIPNKTGGVGYENGSGYQNYISYDVKSRMYNIMQSCYIRIPFTVNAEDLAGFNMLTFRARCDDGFVAFINGSEVASINKPSPFNWNSGCANRPDNTNFAEFSISEHISDLHAGTNILAIHAMNAGASSSDFLISVELIAGSLSSGVAGADLNPGINRVQVQAFDEPNGTGNEIDRGYLDIWYDTGFTNDYPKVITGMVSTQSSQVVTISDPNINLIMRDSFLPGIPVLVRVELLNDEGTINKDIWDTTAMLSVSGNPGISFSPNQVTLRNGMGSALITFIGSGNCTFTATAGSKSKSKVLTNLQGQSITNVSGTLAGNTAWSGIIHVTSDLVVPAGIKLTVNPGTLVLIDGVSTGDTGKDIDIQGTIESLGTAASPITFTAYNPAMAWGEIHHENASVSIYQYTDITRAGNSPRGGHTNSGPAVRPVNSNITFEYCSITDNAGKVMQASSGSNITFRRCHLARSVMGPEIGETDLLFQDSFSTEMFGPDDNDGMYINAPNTGQQIILRGSVFAVGDDDALDTMSANVTVEDCIFRDFVDKGISVYHNSITINRALIVNNGVGIQAKGDALEENVTVNGDHITIKSIPTAGGADGSGSNVGIYAFDKFSVPNVNIYFNITNSIIAAGNPIITDYDPTDIKISYTNIYDEAWPGFGNIHQDPLFVNSSSDFHLQGGSPCLGTGFMGTDQGYYFTTDFYIPAGSLTEDTVWTADQGPYRVFGELTVPADVKLTIGPGTTVYFEPDTSIIVKGIIDANGSEYQRIRMSGIPGAPLMPDIRPELPYSPPKWDGIQFANTMSSENRIAYADIEYAQDEISSKGSVGLVNSEAIIENCSFAGTHLSMISTDSSSAIIRNCSFADMFKSDEWPHLLTPPLDNDSEHIEAVGGIPSGGHYIIEKNVFGTNKGHNDVIDFTGHAQRLPVLQLLDNIFMGGGDELLDLGGDAYIEGNLFQHVHKDISNTSIGNSNAISTGDNMFGETDAVITVVRNYFYDIDHAVYLKKNTFANFVNNTVAVLPDGAEYSAIDFYNSAEAVKQGKGAYLHSNIFQDIPERIFGHPDMSYPSNPSFRTDLQMHYTLVPPERADDIIGTRPGTIMDLGVGNIAADPLFVDYHDNLSLLESSPAKGTGWNGIDMGADIPRGAKISGEPNGLTCHTSVSITVSGPGIVSYKYKINNGVWSSEQSITVPIILSGLLNGNTYTVYVIGKNAAGVWQSEPAASRTWTVDTSYIKLVINEVLAHSHGTAPDMIELYYDGPSSLNMGGMSITENPDMPGKYVFPDPTIINPGEYAVYYADTNTALPNLLGFSLDSYGEGVYLYDTDGTLLDSIEFGNQLNGLTVGRLDDDLWHPTIPTFGAKNTPQPMGDRRNLKINEFLANGDIMFDADFVEIYNPDPLPVDMGGMFLTDDPVAKPYKHQVKQFTFIPPQGCAFFWADGDDNSRTNHINFKLSSDQGFIALNEEDLTQIDRIIYYSQTADISMGRYPDANEGLYFFELPTPEASNVQDPIKVEKNLTILNSLRITEIVYNPSGNDDNLEYAELYNIGTGTIDISGVSFTEGILFTFPSTTTIPAGGYIVLAKNPSAFKTQYPSVPNGIIFGPYSDSFSNNGENVVLTLADPFTAAIMRFEYDDNWYPTTDGGGLALAIIDPTLNPKTWDERESWQAAIPSPGQPNPSQAGWVNLTYDNFESGWGNYISGGVDAIIYTHGGTGTNYAHQGSKTADIQNVSADVSSFYHTNGIDVQTPGYNQIKITFWFYSVSMEPGEDFFVKYFNGTSWQTVAAYVSGTNFSNDLFYNMEIVLNKGTYVFPANMKLKFECSASSVSDDVYIDEIAVWAK